MQPDTRSDSDSLPKLGVNTGYVLGQLAKALRTSENHAEAATRESAERKVANWVAVCEGILSGSLQVGSRNTRPSVGRVSWRGARRLGYVGMLVAPIEKLSGP
jgi:hypothetical protein